MDSLDERLIENYVSAGMSDDRDGYEKYSIMILYREKDGELLGARPA